MLVILHNNNRNSNSADNNGNPEQKNHSSLYDLVSEFAWLKELPTFIQKTFSSLLESLNESAKYIKKVLDLKANKQDLFNENQDYSLSNSNDNDLEDNINEPASLQNTLFNNYVDMSMIINDAKVNYDILPVDIGAKVLPEYQMLGLQQEYLPFI